MSNPLIWTIAEHMFPCRVKPSGPQDPRDRLREGAERRYLHGAVDVDDVLGLPEGPTGALGGTRSPFGRATESTAGGSGPDAEPERGAAGAASRS
jgi:hypothetical protein